jgi:hypothetical protein
VTAREWTEESLPDDYRAVVWASHEVNLPEVGALLAALGVRYRAMLDASPPGSAAAITTAGENVTGWAEAVALARKVRRTPSLRKAGNPS